MNTKPQNINPLNTSEAALLQKVDARGYAEVQTGAGFQREHNAANSLIKKGILKAIFKDQSMYFNGTKSELIFSATVVRV